MKHLTNARLLVIDSLWGHMGKFLGLNFALNGLLTHPDTQLEEDQTYRMMSSYKQK